MTATKRSGGTHPLPLSQLLSQIAREHRGERLSLSELSALLRTRTWGGLLLIFASINILPLPPGTTVITGMPLIILTAQMAAGKTAPWFPQRINKRGLTMKELGRLCAKLLPWERRVQRLLKPRWTGLTSRRATRIIGGVSFLLSLVLSLPIPFIHHAPAVSIALFAVALLYRDGVLVLLGALAAVVSIAVAALTIGSAWLALLFMVHRYLAR